MQILLISDEDLPTVEAGAYEGISSDIYYFIGGLAERNLINEAITHVARLVEHGYLDAFGALAEYVYGEDCEHPDEARWLDSMALYANSCRPGKAEASFQIGALFDKKGDSEKAFTWFLKAAEQGYEEAAIEVGYYLIEGKGTVKNLLEGVRWFMRSLQMEPSPWEVEEEWPITRENGWTDWSLYGEIFNELSSEDRLELTRIIDKKVI